MGTGSSEGKEASIFTVRGVEYVPWHVARGLFDAIQAKAFSEFCHWEDGVQVIPEIVSTPFFKEWHRFPEMEYVNGHAVVPLDRLGGFFASYRVSYFWENLPDLWREAFLARDIFPLDARAKGVKPTPKTPKERALERTRRLDELMASYARMNAPHGALCEMQPKTITVYQEGGRRFISKADMELIHAWMLETSNHAKLPPLPPGIVFAGERAKERNPRYRVEKWIKTECPQEADWGGERGKVSLLELGEFYARHEELWIMLPVALRDYLREELGLRGHRESGIQDNGYGPDGAAEWASHLNDTWPEQEDGWKPVFTAEIIESGRGPWKPAAPVADAPEPRPVADKGTLAEKLRAKAWQEIEAVCTLDGLRFKRKGAPGCGRMFTWDALRLAKSQEGQRLLLELAQSTVDGIASPGTNARRVLVNTVSKRLRAALGLEGRPLENVGGMRTRANFSLIWEGMDRKGDRAPSDD